MFKKAVNLTYQFQYQRKIASQEAICDLLIKRPSNVFETLSLGKIKTMFPTFKREYRKIT